MVQILNQRPSIGELFGSGLSSGIQSGLQTGVQLLAQHKLSEAAQKVAQQKNFNFLKSAFPNADPNILQGLSSADPKLLGAYLQSEASGRLAQGQPVGEPQNIQDLFKSLQAPETQTPVLPTEQEKMIMAEQAMQPGQLPKQKETQPVYPKQPLEPAFISSKEKRERGKESREIRKDVREFTAPYRERADAADADIRDYDLLISAAKSGNLRAGNTQVLLEKLGLEKFNRNYTTQLADKAISRLGQNSRAAFGPGARITNYLEQVFQRSLPNLWNTPEGIIAISEINKRIAQVNKIKDRIAEQLVEETGGNLPLNDKYLVDQRAKPEVDRLEKEILQIAENATSKGSSTFNELPPASSYPNQKIRDKSTGKILQSDGKKWIEV